MPQLRPGSKEAQGLLRASLACETSEIFCEEFLPKWNYLDSAGNDEAVAELVKTKATKTDNKKWFLVLNRKFFSAEWRAEVMSRNPAALTHKEVSDIMKWKLCIGKMRPLQKRLDSNPAASVTKSTQTAIAKMNDNDVKGAMASLQELAAVGAATASAILAMLYPDKVPFMADEVLDILTTRAYTMKQFWECEKEAASVCGIFNRHVNKNMPEWTCGRLWKALWTYAVLARVGKHTSIARWSSSSTTTSKRGAAVDASNTESIEPKKKHIKTEK